MELPDEVGFRVGPVTADYTRFEFDGAALAWRATGPRITIPLETLPILRFLMRNTSSVKAPIKLAPRLWVLPDLPYSLRLSPTEALGVYGMYITTEMPRVLIKASEEVRRKLKLNGIFIKPAKSPAKKVKKVAAKKPTKKPVAKRSRHGTAKRKSAR